LKSSNNYFGWFETITAITGGTLVALNIDISKFGYIFFLMSSVSWFLQAKKNGDSALMIVNVFFFFINILGIYRWFF
jgi:nicotinamide riboside transporter PnuC